MIEENKIKSKAVMDFANMVVGAFQSGFVDKDLTVYDLFQSARNHVKDNYNVDTDPMVGDEAVQAGFNGETKSQWISVEDELPESYGNRYCTGTSPMVDVYTDDERWTDCYYDYDGDCFRHPDMDCIVRDVTHWMPLPKPPTGDK